MTGRHGRRWAVAAGLTALAAVLLWATPLAPGRFVHGPVVPEVLALGDSVAAGAACGCEPFPALYARALAPGGRATDLARSGFTSADVLDQVGDPAIDPAVRTASIIVIMIGANDLAAVFDADGTTAAYQRAAATVGTNVTTTLRRIRAIRAEPAPVLVLGYWNVVEDGDAARDDYSAEDAAEAATITGYANDALRAAATAESATYVPTLPAFKGTTGTADPTPLLTDDGDHPNAQGHEAIAAALYAAHPALTS